MKRNYFLIILILIITNVRLNAQSTLYISNTPNKTYGGQNLIVNETGNTVQRDPDKAIRVRNIGTDTTHTHSFIDSLQFEQQGLALKYSKKDTIIECNYSEWKLLQYELKSYLSYHTNHFPSFLSIENVANHIKDYDDEIPIAITYFTYDLSVFDVYEGRYVWVTQDGLMTAAIPYDDKQFQNAISLSNSVRFVIPSSMFSSNLSGSIDIDFDDGQGYQNNLNLNTLYNITYSNAGDHFIKVKYHSFTIEIKLTTFGFDPSNGYWDAPDPVIGDTFSGSSGKIWWRIYFGKGNQFKETNKPLVNPIILAEGFDPKNETQFNGMVSLGAGFMNYLISQGYDIILVNYDEGGDYIQRNSSALKNLIKNVIPIYSQIPIKRIPLVGYSMGGVVSYYTTRLLDSETINPISTVISVDSPHRGATIPQSVQLCVDFLNSVNPNSSTQENISKLSSPAAKQMLMYNLFRGINDYGDYINFYNEYINLGKPIKSRTVAISSGTSSSTLRSPGGLSVEIGANADGWVRDPFFGSKLWTINVFRLHLKLFDDGASSPFYGYYYKVTEDLHLLYGSIMFEEYDPGNSSSNESSFPVNSYKDYSGGGWRDTYQTVRNEIVSAVDRKLYENADDLNGYVLYGTVNNQNHSFIPIGSALALTNNYFAGWTLDKTYENTFNGEHTRLTEPIDPNYPNNPTQPLPQLNNLIEEINFGSGGFVRGGIVNSGEIIDLSGIPEVKLQNFSALYGSDLKISPISTTLPVVQSSVNPETNSNPISGREAKEVNETAGLSSGNSEKLVSGINENYPNPFNPLTQIKYSIASKGLVSLEVYNLLGQRIKSLVNETLDKGKYEATFDGKSLSSGIYFSVLKVNNQIFTKKMFLMK